MLRCTVFMKGWRMVMRFLTTGSVLVLWLAGLIWLPHTAPFMGSAARWLWWIFTGTLMATSVTDLIWQRIYAFWPQVALGISVGVGLWFGLWHQPIYRWGLVETISLGIVIIPVLWRMHSRLAAGDWWLIGLGALSFASHPLYFACWVAVSLGIAIIITRLLYAWLRAAEPLPFLPMALVGDLIVRTVWTWPGVH